MGFPPNFIFPRSISFAKPRSVLEPGAMRFRHSFIFPRSISFAKPLRGLEPGAMRFPHSLTFPRSIFAAWQPGAMRFPHSLTFPRSIPAAWRLERCGSPTVLHFHGRSPSPSREAVWTLTFPPSIFLFEPRSGLVPGAIHRPHNLSEKLLILRASLNE